MDTYRPLMQCDVNACPDYITFRLCVVIWCMRHTHYVFIQMHTYTTLIAVKSDFELTLLISLHIYVYIDAGSAAPLLRFSELQFV